MADKKQEAPADDAGVGDVKATIDDGSEAPESDEKKEEESPGVKTPARRSLALQIPLPLKLSPQQLGIALLALIGLGLGITATLQTYGYRRQFNEVLRAAKDPANYGFYKEVNAKVRTDRLYRPGTLAIVYGAELGFEWEMLRVLRDKRVINRSIAKQDMVDLMLRLDQDVLGLQPRDMIFLPPLSGVDHPQDLLVRTHLLCAAARAYGVRPVLATLPPIPAAHDTLTGGYRGRIRSTNNGLRAIASAGGFAIMDFFTLLVGDDHCLKEEYCGKGLLPNPSGYRVMTDVLEAVVDSLAEAGPLEPLMPLAAFCTLFGGWPAADSTGAEGVLRTAADSTGVEGVLRTAERR